VDNPEDDEPDFRKGDSVALRGREDSGRIVGPGAAPGTWRVRFVSRDGPAADQVRDVPEEQLEHTY
jgi:hypothetical protein